MTGPELRQHRRAAEVDVAALAREIGLSRQTIHIIEKQAVPAPAREREYLDGVERLRKIPAPAGS